jgi:hypothetical protein
LRKRLTFWFYNNKNEFKDSDGKVEDYLFNLSGFDGRLVEIYYPIWTVSPTEKKPILAEYLQDLGELQLQEELRSFDCEVLIAILKVYENNGHRNWFPTKEVTESFNEELDDREKQGSRSIGRQISKFGFRPHRSNKQKGWLWDEKLVEELKQRFPITEDTYKGTIEKTAQIAQMAQSTQIKLA